MITTQETDIEAPPKARYILMLEDSEPIVDIIQTVLTEELPSDVQIIVARTIEQAQQLALEYQAELFILDVNLPDGTGLDFLCDLRTTHPDARVLVMTANPIPEYREEAARLGVVHFLSKPFDLTIFSDTVRTLLTPPENRQELFEGTLRNLHITDVIQIKCIGASTCVLEFTSPEGNKGLIYFERGNVVHAATHGYDGVSAFNEIVSWRGGSFSELVLVGETPRTIKEGWQSLLMEAVRLADEANAASEGDMNVEET